MEDWRMAEAFVVVKKIRTHPCSWEKPLMRAFNMNKAI